MVATAAAPPPASPSASETVIPTTSRRRPPRRPVVIGVALVAGLWSLALGVNRNLVRVRGDSMRPTLEPGELLLTRPVRDAAALRPGSVVVVEDPLAAGHLVVKRLVEVAPSPTDGLDEVARITVLGDAPGASTDSRQWGALPVGAVRRVAVVRWPSLSRTGLRDRR